MECLELKVIYLDVCVQLRHLPPGMSHLASLKSLSIINCHAPDEEDYCHLPGTAKVIKSKEAKDGGGTTRSRRIISVSHSSDFTLCWSASHWSAHTPATLLTRANVRNSDHEPPRVILGQCDTFEVDTRTMNIFLAGHSHGPVLSSV